MKGMVNEKASLSTFSPLIQRIPPLEFKQVFQSSGGNVKILLDI